VWVVCLTDGRGFPVTDGETRNLSPSWSADSEFVYFVSNRGGSMDLWRRRIGADGAPIGTSQRLTTGVGMVYARLSPDGKRVIYSKGRRTGNLWRAPLLENRPATWSDAQQLTDGQGLPNHVSLSPDGRQLLFCVRGPEVAHIWKMPAGGGDPERVLMDPMEQIWPRWSPDGQKIAFHSNLDIWVVSVAGGPALRLTEQEGPDICPTWSPDGREIAFNSTRSGNVDVWIVPVQGGEARQLTNDPADDWAHAWPGGSGSWSPDGTSIVYGSSLSGNWNIWVAPTAGGEPRQLTNDPAYEQWPTWSPDGRWVIFCRAGDWPWRVPAEGGEAEPVLGEDGRSLIWSPGGDRMYFVARREGRENLYEKELGGTAERQLTELAGRVGYLASLDDSDGEFLYFTWSEDFRDVWMMDVEQGR
jgi:Tol biopolymer transport system component